MNRLSPGSFEITGVCDLNQERIDDFKKWWGDVPLSTTDYHDLFRNMPPEFLVISSSIDSHLSIVMDAIQAGVKSILIEKPVSFTLEETFRIYQKANAQGARVWVNFERRYHPFYARIKQIIDEKTLGPIRSIEGRVFTGSGFDPNTECGPLLHDAVHWIDLLIWYFGEPDSMEGRLIRNNGENMYDESSLLSFHYNDFSASLHTDGRRKYFEFTMILDFESGRIFAGNTGFQLYKTSASKRYSGFQELIEEPFSLNWENPWVNLYSEILKTENAFRENRNQIQGITASLNDALSGMKLLDNVYKSS